jgi:asparagine synthetase B (glutamine-hydrolysing)
MCGICGVYKLDIRDSDDLTVSDQNSNAETIFHNLLLDMEDRGKDATGFACIVRNSGGENEVFVQKQDIRASEFLKTKKFRKLAWALSKSRCVIGHCRARTKGSEKDNRNNPPLWSKSSGKVVVHNGVINNDYKIKSKEDFKTDGEVDSEVILRLLEKYPKLEDTTSKLYGSFACAMLDATSPDSLLLFRHTNPLYVGYIEQYRLIVFASTEDAVLDCCGIDSGTKILGFFKLVDEKDNPKVLCQEIDNNSWLSVHPVDDFVCGEFTAGSNKDYDTVYRGDSYNGCTVHSSYNYNDNFNCGVKGSSRPLCEGDESFFRGVVDVDGRRYINNHDVIKERVASDGVVLGDRDLFGFLCTSLVSNDGLLVKQVGETGILGDIAYYGL